VLNIMGGSDIDLNDAELSRTVTELSIYSIMGGCEVPVPHGVDVHVSNFAAMGGNDV
jgi:predicted membrane protein